MLVLQYHVHELFNLLMLFGIFEPMMLRLLEVQYLMEVFQFKYQLKMFNNH
jgi:hypothetical protein